MTPFGWDKSKFPGFNWESSADVDSFDYSALMPNLTTHIDMSASPLMYQATDEAAATGDGQVIGRIYDQVGGFKYDQTTAARKPTFSASAGNGLGAMLCDGTQFVDCTDAGIGGPFGTTNLNTVMTFFFVGKILDAGVPYFQFEGDDYYYAQTGEQFNYDSGDPRLYANFQPQATTGPSAIRHGHWRTGGSYTVSFPGLADYDTYLNKYMVSIRTFKNAQFAQPGNPDNGAPYEDVRQNYRTSTLNFTGDNDGGAAYSPLQTYDFQTMQIGGNNVDGFRWDGEICEIGWANDFLDYPDMALLSDHLAAKWGLI